MTNPSEKSRIKVTVVTDHHDMLSAIMIRSAVYVGEYGVPLSIESDGNDFTATHLLAKVDGSPAGTMRIRYFKDIAVLERMAILKDYRMKRYGCRGVAWELGAFAFHFCRVKGYTKFYGTARDGLVGFWQRFAPEGAEFVPIPDAEKSWADIRIHPMEGSAPPLPGSVDGYGRLDLLSCPESELPDKIVEKTPDKLAEAA